MQKKITLDRLIENGRLLLPEAVPRILAWYQEYKHLLFDDYYPTEPQDYVGHLLNDLFSLDGYVWIIRVDGEMAGLVYLNDWYGDGARMHSCQLHGILDRRFHRQGIGTEVGRQMLDRLFNQWHLYRVEGWIDPDNTAMRALAHKLGFRLEGTVRGRRRVRGEPRDELVYGLIRPDYLASQSRPETSRRPPAPPKKRPPIPLRNRRHSPHEPKKEKRQ